jgi:hypothetical protein
LLKALSSVTGEGAFYLRFKRSAFTEPNLARMSQGLVCPATMQQPDFLSIFLSSLVLVKMAIRALM